MKKLFGSSFLALIAVIVATTTAFAGGPGCAVNIAATEGAAPFTTNIEVTGSEGDTFVVFGDGTNEFGRYHVHEYVAVSRYTITAIVNATDGNVYRCHGYVTVTNAETAAYEPYGDPFSDYPDQYELDAFGVSDSVSVDMNDNNVAPVINGDNNTVTVNAYNEPATTITVTALEKANASVQVAPQKLTFWQRAWQIVSGFIVAPIDAMIRFFEVIRDAILGPALVSIR